MIALVLSIACVLMIALVLSIAWVLMIALVLSIEWVLMIELVISIAWVGASEGGAGGIGPPHSKIWGGRSMFCPPHEICINKFYIY